MTDRLGPVVPSVAGFVLLVAGFVVFAQLSATSSYSYLPVGLVLTAVGMALPIATTALVALTAAPGAEGEAAGIFNMAHNLGRPLGLATLGVTLAQASIVSYRQVFWVSAAYAVLGIVVSSRLGPAQNAVPAAAPPSGHAAPSASAGKRSTSPEKIALDLTVVWRVYGGLGVLNGLRRPRTKTRRQTWHRRPSR